MILVIISTAVTTVTAISADSDMTISVLVTITESIISKNEYIFGYGSTQNPLHKKKDHWQARSPSPRVFTSTPRDYKGTYGRKKALRLYIQGAPHQDKEYKEEAKL